MNWPGGWVPLPEGSAGLEDQLRRELRSGHELHGRSVRAIGRDPGSDDVLFELTDTGELALVHLTWSRRREKPPFPWTTVYPSFDAFAEALRTLPES